MNKIYKLNPFNKGLPNMAKKVCLAAILLFGINTNNLHSQITYTFTSAGATGRFGPTQTQVNTAYLSTNLNGLVATTSATSGIQTFTIPTGVTSVTIEAFGAEGGLVGTNVGGKGASMKGTFAVNPGDVLNIVVGQQGLMQQTNNCNGGGGGGGSFVYQNSAPQPMIVAGGGGGCHKDIGPGIDGTVTTSAATSANVSGTTGIAGTGGGEGLCTSGWPGAGGGGWISAGGSTCLWSSFPTQGGQSQFSWLGGARNQNTTPGTQGQDGSFGAGGAAFHGAGGGGGYSGGGGGGSCSVGNFLLGGGGGSYNAGSNQTNVSGIKTGHGLVLITTSSCTPGSAPSVSTSISNLSICANNSTTLSVVGTGTLNWYSTPSSTVSLASGSVLITPTLATGNYTYYAASTNTCSEGARTPVTVTVIASPTIAISGGTAIACGAQPINLTASGADTYSWSTGATTSTTAPAPNVNTTYTVTGTSSVTGCKSKAVISVSVIPAPSLLVIGTTTFCIGSSTSTVLTVSGADTYTWSTSSNSTSIAVTPTITTTYTVSGTSTVTSCSNTITATIVVSNCTALSPFSSIEVVGVSMYPNPTNGIFIIELNSNSQIIIMNILGDEIINKTVNAGKHELNIKNQSNGVYFIKVINEGGHQTSKLIKE